MSIKLTKRVAALLLKRGESSIRIKNDAFADAAKAITRDDVRALIKDGKIYALQQKHNISARGKLLNIKRSKGRRRGPGSRKGTRKARQGLEYKKLVRGQRRVIKSLKAENLITNDAFKRFYALVKGGTFTSKVTLLNYIRNTGVQIDDEKFNKLRHI